MNCPLTKEEFCSAIDTIKDYWDNMQKGRGCYRSSIL